MVAVQFEPRAPVTRAILAVVTAGRSCERIARRKPQLPGHGAVLGAVTADGGED